MLQKKVDQDNESMRGGLIMRQEELIGKVPKHNPDFFIFL